jgi:hypothetical protein
MLNEFEFFVPIEKAGIKEENGKRIIYGVASSENIDMQGEVVGCEAIRKSLKHLLSFGRIDYDHRSKISPKFIIGEPMEAKFDSKNNFHIKGLLYKGVEIADDCWKQLKAGNSRLGWSIGGRVIAKAMQFDKSLNHVALTPHPINTDTFATIKPYGEWLKSLGDPKNNCCGMCMLGGERICNKAISTAGNTALGTNPVIPQDLEKDVKILQFYIKSPKFSSDPKESMKYFLGKGVERSRIKDFAKYILKNKTKIGKINQKLNQKGEK